MRSGLPI
jgi:hypothetical protein